ncbi:MAG: FlgN protein [Rhodobacteraceae bacterium HLUCCA24]|nr:MAG: FlgN protein [Rhodobacteraceae bacterium HLUCCA24]
MTGADDVIDRLDRLLDEERALLRAGRLEALAELLVRKESLASRLAEAGMRGTPAPALRHKIARNQRLLEGAMAGLGDVAKRLVKVREVSRTLDTYGSDGRRAAIDMPGNGRIERRA